jgi:hypothetical protein
MTYNIENDKLINKLNAEREEGEPQPSNPYNSLTF